MFTIILAIVEHFVVAHMNTILVHMKPAILVIQNMIVLHNIHAISMEIVCAVICTIHQLVDMNISILVLV